MELRNYLDEHSRNVLRIGDVLYQGRYDLMLKDMYDARRRDTPPVSKKLGRALDRDIGILYTVLSCRC